MINQLRRRFAFDAQHAPVGMVMVRTEASYLTVFHCCDSCAVSRAKRTVAAHPVRTFCVIGHRVETMSKADGYATRRRLENRNEFCRLPQLLCAAVQFVVRIMDSPMVGKLGMRRSAKCNGQREYDTFRNTKFGRRHDQLTLSVDCLHHDLSGCAVVHR